MKPQVLRRERSMTTVVQRTQGRVSGVNKMTVSEHRADQVMTGSAEKVEMAAPGGKAAILPVADGKSQLYGPAGLLGSCQKTGV